MTYGHEMVSPDVWQSHVDVCLIITLHVYTLYVLVIPIDGSSNG